ncbi:beta strand repeat-containing protein [Pseudoalteromonas denitrificans]|uniref:Ig-like domain (Group 1) n=1 Tax=Pseudoalteromonas denitrificans DSM 6059 TaxID=1123010 RepID=A0A1I1R590_9GAMM|nr:hypothetical protein [Pseudoalteromonas denitrificans]SFD25460.1 Ig-like domain (group 1) [Pseudoalteromonas denitrificans DSM 6059]
MPLIRFFCIMLISIAITACGGGGSLESPGGGSNDTYKIETISLTSSNGTVITEVSKEVPGTVTIQLTKNSNAIANQLISFSLGNDVGVLFPGVATALTDANGNAKISLIAGSKSGAGTITATYQSPDSSSLTESLSFDSKGDDTTASAYFIKVITTSVTLQADVITNVQAEISKSGSGTETQNKLITFSLDGEGEMFPQNGSVPTVLSEDGTKSIATIQMLAGKSAGSGILTATFTTIEGETLSVPIPYTSLGGGSGISSDGFSMVTSITTANSGAITSSNPGTITTRLFDFLSDGLRSDQLAVQYSLSDQGVLVPMSGISPFTFDGTSVTAKAILAPLNKNGSGTATATFVTPSGETLTNELGYTVTAPSLSLVLSLVTPDTDTSIINVSQALPGELKAQITTTDDAPFDGFDNKLIQFSTEKTGTINPSLGTALTDANGLAKVTLLPSTQEGAGIAKATYTTTDGLLLEASYNFMSAGDAPVDGGSTDISIALNLTDGTGKVTTQVSAASPLTIAATVTDAAGSPVNARVVTFASTLGEFIPKSGTALTDSTGTAIITLTAGTIEGAAEVTASFDSAKSTSGFYTKGDVIVDGQLEADVAVKLLVNCPVNWELNRNTTELNPTDCTEVTSISSGDPAIIYSKTTKKGSTIPLNGLIVAGASTLGTVLPESGTALTDNFGIGLLSLLAGNDVGAGQVSVTAINTTTSTAFEIGAADISLSIDNGLTQNTKLSAGSTTVVTVTIKDAQDNLFLTPLEVQFTSGCATTTPALSVIDEKVTSIGGLATATYRANGCIGVDTVTATAITGGDAKIISTTIDVLESSVGSIEFVSVSATELALKGTGGQTRTETSEVTFKLVDENGNPVTQKEISFELSTDSGGLTIAPIMVSTDNEGLARTTVRSGYVPSSVVVKALYVPSSGASAVDEQILSVSSLLTITTGLPDNNSFTASPAIFNSETLDYDGDLVDISVYMGDSFNNTVPDGTSVNMTTEGGAVGTIDGEQFNPQLSCSTTDGACKLQWRAQNPRPFTESKYNNTITAKCDTWFNNSAPCTLGIRNILRDAEGNAILDNPATTKNIQYLDSNGAQIVIDYSSTTPRFNSTDFQWDRPLGGRFTVTAYAEGQESFIDLNDNGLFDFGEYYSGYDLTEVFKDHNENDVYDNANRTGCADPSDPCNPDNSTGGEFETYEDKNGDGQYNLADGKYNGLLCTDAASQQAVGGCSKELVHVRRNVSMVMSGSAVFARAVTAIDGVKVTAGCASYTVLDTGADAADPADDSIVTLLQLEPSDIPGFCDVAGVDLTSAINGVTSSALISALPITVIYSDIYNNPPPFETDVSISASNGELSGSGGFSIANTSSRIPGRTSFTISREGTGNKKTSGTITLEFITKKKVESAISITVLDDR